MSIKDVLAMVLDDESENAAIEAARRLAEHGNGVARALMFEVVPDAVYLPDGFTMGMAWNEAADSAHRVFLSQSDKLKRRLHQYEPPMRMQTESALTRCIDENAALHGRVADIVVMRLSQQDDVLRRLFQGVLFGSGRPVLLVPSHWAPRPIGRKVVIGWNARREAARAVSAATPILDDADQVSIVTVDASPSMFGYSDLPGTGLGAYLARRGQSAEVRNLDGLGRSEGRALLDECLVLDADLLVMGGFGRPRLQQLVFGGATQTVLAEAHLPVLMAH